MRCCPLEAGQWFLQARVTRWQNGSEGAVTPSAPQSLLPPQRLGHTPGAWQGGRGWGLVGPGTPGCERTRDAMEPSSRQLAVQGTVPAHSGALDASRRAAVLATKHLMVFGTLGGHWTSVDSSLPWKRTDRGDG